MDKPDVIVVRASLLALCALVVILAGCGHRGDVAYGHVCTDGKWHIEFAGGVRTMTCMPN